MSVEELKQYLKDNLRFSLYKTSLGCNEFKLTLSIYIEDEEIQEADIYIQEGE